MKILEFTNQTKASELAVQLLAEAKKHEPQITKDIKAVAKLNNAELIGLENKFKSKLSLARKIADYSAKQNISLEQSAEEINDGLRYTIIFAIEDYQNGFKNTLESLESQNYKIEIIWNAWKNENKDWDSGYRGINATIISSQNQIFELQFHTTESFRLKTETHGLYEEKRSQKTSRERVIEILQITRKLAADIERPKGI